MSPSTASCAASNRAKFFAFQADEIYVEVFLLKAASSGAEVPRPSRRSSELVVRNNQSPSLCLGKTAQYNDRHVP